MGVDMMSVLWERLTSESLIFLANEILDGDFDIFKCYVCSSTTPYTLTVHPSGAYTAVFTLNEKHTNTSCTLTACTNSGSEVIAPDAIGNPFFLAIDNVMLSIFRKFSFAIQVCNVASGVRLGNG